MRSVLLTICLCLTLAVGCVAPQRPTEEQYQAAQVVLSNPASTPEQRSDAYGIVDAYDAPPIDWWTIGGSALGALLGVPFLGGRGRQLVGAFGGAIRSGDLKRAAASASAYVGARHSSDLLDKAG